METEQEFTINEDTRGSVIYDFDSTNDIILCLEVNNKQLGVAVFDCQTRGFRVSPQDYFVSTLTVASSLGVSYYDEINAILGSIILGENPTLCLLSSRLDSACYNFVKEKEENMNFKVDVQSNKIFRKVKELKNLNFEVHTENVLLDEIYLNSKTNAKASAAAFGAILHILKQHAEGVNDDLAMNEDETITTSLLNMVRSLKPLETEGIMFIDEDTIASLQIFPSSHNFYSEKVNKEGCFSIFQLLNHTSSNHSKKLLTSWLTAPLTDINKIKARQAVIEILLDEANGSQFQEIQYLIKKCPDMFSVFNQFCDGKETYRTWLNLELFLEICCSLFRTVHALDVTDYNNILSRIKALKYVKTLHSLSQHVSSIMDIENTKDTKQATIAYGVDKKLDKYRTIYNELEGILVEVANNSEDTLTDVVPLGKLNEVRRLKENDIVNAVYIPELGYLVALDILVEEHFVTFQDIMWEEVFRTSTHIYFKTEETSKLDEAYGDICSKISDLRIEILYSLKVEILNVKTSAIEFYELIAELDVLQSFAQVSQTNDYTKPKMVLDESFISVKKARHPLYETTVSIYIPNDLTLDGGKYSDEHWFEHDKNRVNILSGANASGKTVFITQIALLCYLAQIGCYVPADNATIGIVDKILTRIRTEETVTKLQSSFELDSRQMSKCLAFATPRSLVLIDEYGKGTDVIDGPALFGAIIKHLSTDKACPRVLATTHFHELFKPDLLTTHIPGVQHYVTEILWDNTTPGSETEPNFGLTFLYTIKKGICDNSFGVYCAKICGLKKSIVERGQQLTALIAEGKDIVSEYGTLSQKEINDFERNQRIVKRFMAWDLDLESTTTGHSLAEKLKNMLQDSTA
ncbi:MutS family protein MSH5 KNAG_0C03870 [Huiozyma naganishii CBS 8797]|uniref:DNA mismatch repair proteins mutS family domain-containing protein n=1 Tax=Huiozyma naganishii (strain ATCC MYA-139 / BCRC 22969 / CBS 8797 / KCTC 17520 / NBRC 10181 / NCYC 3082 / Yp74L-3) TaxID=1071383 RepID=J7S630_HUIN7|nr:hypothetical protein KNAG_0C03870 [Kazachstania naganishii CBS 8797]CCK69491.1 hypothetical protein KNAG_0C03870 [Kazachstania naganishii CBS 8797]